MKGLSLLKVQASETIVFNSLALEKINRGEKVYNLSAGEPMIPTPPPIVRAMLKATKEHKTHYPPAFGIPELRKASALWMNKLYGSDFNFKNTLVTSGGKFGIFVLLQALLNKDDEVLIPAPYWVSYPSMVKLFKGTPKILHTTVESGWKITPKDIIKNTNNKTKILIFNNAGNPTGSIYNQTEVAEILKIAKKYNLFVISDEVYSGLVYDGKKFISCSSFPEYKDRVAIIQSCSKNFAMTGFRVGFVFADEEIIKVLGGLVSQSTSGATTMCQWAALTAILQAENFTPKINAVMQKRRDVFVKEFNKAFSKNIPSLDSALYAFVSLKEMGWQGKNSYEFCKEVLEKIGVAIVPGSAFGQEGYVRFSFGEDSKIITGGIKVLAKWIRK